MIYLTTMQIAFIVVVPVVVIVGLFLLIRFPLAHFYQRLNFNNYVYHRVYRIVLNNDYYLINNYVFSIDEVHQVRVDHIIFAEKYIYICVDRYNEGNLMGNDTNASLIQLSRITRSKSAMPTSRLCMVRKRRCSSSMSRAVILSMSISR